MTATSISSSPDSKALNRWTLLLLLSSAAFINYLDRTSISVAMPSIARELHLDARQQGFVLSAFFWSYALMQLPMGWLIDRFHVKRVYTVSFALWTVAVAMTALAHSYATLIAMRVLLGVGESVYLPAGIKVISMTFAPRDRTFPSGVFDVGCKAGLAIGVVVDASVIVWFGWRGLFLQTGLLGLLWLFPWVLLFPQDNPGRPAQAAAPASAGDNAESKPSLRGVGVRLGRAAHRLATNRTVLGISIGFFCWDYFWYFLITWLPIYLMTVRHVSLGNIRLFGSLPFLIIGISETVGCWVVNRIIAGGADLSRASKIAIALGFGMGLFVIPTATAHGFGSAMIFLALASTSGLLIGSLLLIPANCAPPGEVGLWVGIQNFWGNVAGVIAPALTGILIKATGSYMPAFECCAIVLVVGIVAYVWIVPRIDSSAPQPAAAK
jgi:ACS family D-galactonate transporter-like MFS transporter